MVVHGNAEDQLTFGLSCIAFGPEQSHWHNKTTKLRHYYQPIV
jgi:hypothetical protein